MDYITLNGKRYPVSDFRFYSTNCTNPAIGGEKRTNADRIRSMTDEELADFLMDVSINCGVQIGTGIGTARWYILDWLKQESK